MGIFKIFKKRNILTNTSHFIDNNIFIFLPAVYAEKNTAKTAINAKTTKC